MTPITLDPERAEAQPAPAPPRRRRRWRERVARAERPLLFAGLALVTAHLLDLALHLFGSLQPRRFELRASTHALHICVGGGRDDAVATVTGV